MPCTWFSLGWHTIQRPKHPFHKQMRTNAYFFFFFFFVFFFFFFPLSCACGNTSTAIPKTTARNTLTFDGCLRTYIATVWIGIVSPFIASLSLSLSLALMRWFGIFTIIWGAVPVLYPCLTHVIMVSYLLYHVIIF